jgi:hypothetical protein
MKLNTKTFILVAAIATVFTSCYYDNLEDLHPAPVIIPGINDNNSTNCDTTKAITYNNDIKAILDNNCGTGNSCHNGSSSLSGIDLATYDGAKAIASKLIGAVSWDGTASNMPKGSTSKINDCNIAKIKKWVNTGTAQ